MRLSLSAILIAAVTLALAAAPVAAGRGELALRDSFGPTTLPGVSIDNFGVVASRIFRGARPGSRGLGELRALGVGLVIDLRDSGTSEEAGDACRLGLDYVNIPIDDRQRPTLSDVERFLELVDRADARGTRVFVHCAGGRHRTGALVACYRIARDGWDYRAAYDEMLAYEYYASRGHGGHREFVAEFAALYRRSP